jgi:hypothetical protein
MPGAYSACFVQFRGGTTRNPGCMPCIYGARLYNHVNSGVDVGTLTLDRTVMNYEISSTVGAACIRVPNFNPKIILNDQHGFSNFSQSENVTNQPLSMNLC